MFSIFLPKNYINSKEHLFILVGACGWLYSGIHERHSWHLLTHVLCFVCFLRQKAEDVLNIFIRNPKMLFRKSFHISSVQSLSCVQLFATPWIAAHQASLSITNSRSSLRLTSIRVSDAIQPSHPLSFPSPPAPNPSQHQSLFQWVNSSHEVARVLDFQL